MGITNYWTNYFRSCVCCLETTSFWLL